MPRTFLFDFTGVVGEAARRFTERLDTGKFAVRYLVRLSVSGGVPAGSDRAFAIARTLHENFYENQMTAQDTAEALDDVEALLGKLERIMSD